MNGPVRITLICLIVSGVCEDVTIEQPPILIAPLGENVTLPCHIKLSNASVTNTLVVYWDHKREDRGKPIPICCSPIWKSERVSRLLNDSMSLNKSIQLKHVQWKDGGKFLSKVSVTTHQERSFRKTAETEMLIYDGVFFNTIDLNNSQLECRASVSNYSGFALSISFNDQILNSTSSLNSTSELYVNLTETTTFRRHHKYQCSLTFNGKLVTSSIFQDELSGPLALDGEYPQPWFLYGGLILVQLVFLVVLTISFLRKSCL